MILGLRTVIYPVSDLVKPKVRIPLKLDTQSTAN